MPVKKQLQHYILKKLIEAKITDVTNIKVELQF
jgi:hypothetical protein